MYFDVTYTDPAQVPRLLAHAVTVAVPAGGPGLPAYYATAGYTEPVPVGCRPLAVLHPPLVGHGWFDANGCCAIIDPALELTLCRFRVVSAVRDCAAAARWCSPLRRHAALASAGSAQNASPLFTWRGE